MAAAFLVEVVLAATFILMILGSTSNKTTAGFAPIAIGLGLALIHMIAIPVTNTSVNPARSTAVVPFAETAASGQLWLFWIAQLIGAAVGAAIWIILLAERDTKHAPAAGICRRLPACGRVIRRSGNRADSAKVGSAPGSEQGQSLQIRDLTPGTDHRLHQEARASRIRRLISRSRHGPRVEVIYRQHRQRDHLGRAWCVCEVPGPSPLNGLKRGCCACKSLGTRISALAAVPTYRSDEQTARLDRLGARQAVA